METSLRRAILESRNVEFSETDQHAAVAIVLCGPQLELLMIRRADHPDDPWSGHMALPGGRREPGDVDLEATAIRETFEEVGVDLRPAEFWGTLRPMLAQSKSGKHRLWVTPCVFRVLELRPTTVPDESEVAEVLWIPLQALLKKEIQTKRTLHRPEGTLTLPAWQIGSRVIWGLTHAILSQLLKHAKDMDSVL